MFAPICGGADSCKDAYYGPQEKYWHTGDSFNMTVKQASPPAPGGFDLMFKGSESGSVPCNYMLTFKEIEISCP